MNDMINEAFNANAINAFNPYILARFARATYYNNTLFNDITSAQESIDSWLNPKYGNHNPWQIIDTNGGINGFQAIAAGLDANNDGVYDQVVIAFRGTDSFLDKIADLEIFATIKPDQELGAYNFYEKIFAMESVKGAQIYLTGHSLGGALAELTAIKYGEEAMTFNSPGMLSHGGSAYYLYQLFTKNDVEYALGDDENEVKYLIDYYYQNQDTSAATLGVGDGFAGLEDDHAYAVKSVNPNYMELVNPWDTTENIKVSIKDLADNFGKYDFSIVDTGLMEQADYLEEYYA